ncbi:MAG TPA: response regulator transcription factor [Nocardioides sp.]|uniref:response regulator transcription factor n=1 Tax=Nocardioides sp. TaxID=35761 RepID=UPI002ED7C06B
MSERDEETGLRVVVADDHPVYREGLALVLGSLPGVTVVGEAGDGLEAVDLAARLQPDVVLMDLSMPGLGGVEATRRIVADVPGVHVLVLSMHEGADSVVAALRAGARGYLVKGATKTEVARALHDVAAGGAVFGEGVAEQVLLRVRESPLTARRGAEAFPELTDRELEVLDLVAGGLSNAAISGRLFLSDKTVRNVVSNVIAKLGARDRPDAILRARRAGLGELR